MAKTDTVSPKRHLLTGLHNKVATTFRRSLGELERTRSSAVGAERELAKAQDAIWDVFQRVLAATDLPVVKDDVPAPGGAHWVVAPLQSPRNALYARTPLTSSVAYVEANGTCPIGAVFFPLEDIRAMAEVGLGLMAPDRLRCGNRTEVPHTLAMLPWKTVDVVTLNLLKTLDDAGIHTRKSGNTMADVLDVAAGRADMAMATRITRLEALLSNLFMAESAGFASDMHGKPLHPGSETLLVANPKLHPKVVAVLKG